MDKFHLQLYVIGQSLISKRAVRNLEALCDLPDLKNNYKIEVIDIIEHADLAEKEKILATPLLIKNLPLPKIRLIGDLSDTKEVLDILTAPAHTYDQ